MKLTRFIILVFAVAALLLLTGCGDTIDKLKARDQLNKGVKAFRDRAYEEAANCFKEALKFDKDLNIAKQYLASSYMQQYIPNLPTEKNELNAKLAISTFEEVLQLDPNNVNAIQSIASLYNALGDYTKSKEFYQRRVRLEPQNPVPLYGIGVINYSIVNQETGPNGEYVANLTPEKKAELNQIADEGIDVLKKALELNKDYYDAMSYLNLVYRKKAMLTDDEATRNSYTNQADRLAAQALILKKKIQEEEAKKKKMF